MLKRRSCCLASNWFRGVGVPLAMMAYPVKKKDWAAISQASRCTIKLSSCWIWSRIMRYQSRGPRESRESLFRGADIHQGKRRRWSRVTDEIRLRKLRRDVRYTTYGTYVPADRNGSARFSNSLVLR